MLQFRIKRQSETVMLWRLHRNRLPDFHRDSLPSSASADHEWFRSQDADAQFRALLRSQAGCL
ncbi:MAG: hypothetical protein ABJF23_10600 [Bryobacteraceae bacterium]